MKLCSLKPESGCKEFTTEFRIGFCVRSKVDLRLSIVCRLFTVLYFETEAEEFKVDLQAD